MKKIAAVTIAAGVAGYVMGRTRPGHELREWNWRNIVLGPKGRKVNHADAFLYMALHPVRMAQSLPWSPFYRKPEPPKVISLDEIFMKRPEAPGE